MLLGAYAAGVGLAGRMTPAAALFLAMLTFVWLANGPLPLLVRSGAAHRPVRDRAVFWLVL